MVWYGSGVQLTRCGMGVAYLQVSGGAVSHQTLGSPLLSLGVL